MGKNKANFRQSRTISMKGSTPLCPYFQGFGLEGAKNVQMLAME